jgi:hypothetical protein
MSTSAQGDSLPIVEQPPQAPPEVLTTAKTTSPAAGIQYLDSLSYIFSHPDWLKNFLIFTVFLLIPVFNTVLYFGYLYEIAEHRHRRLAGPYPLFEIRKFAAYMTRGIWCFFLMGILQIILLPIVQVLWNGTFFGSMAAMQSGDWGVVIVSIVVPLVIITFAAFLLALQVLMTPFLIRGGLSQNFGLMADFRWVVHYLCAMWVETTLVSLFLLFASVAFSLLGCLLFCVGLFAVGPLMAMAHAHLHRQLYELFLARGGQPIPLRPLAADVPPVVQA